MNEKTPPKEVSLSAKDLDLEEKLDSLPNKPGVYQFKNSEAKVLYVGKAQSLRSRVRQYFQKSRAADPKLDVLVPKIADVELVVTDNEVEALILEANLIKKFKPRYNVILKDDKSYPFIVVTNDPFPRVFVTRRKVGLGGRYFGPYTDVKTMRFALKTVRDIFMIRSCNYDLTEESVKAGKFKLCLDYHIKKCEGPCEGLVSREHYNEMISQVSQVLRGKTDSLVLSLQKAMEQFSEDTKFEDAARVRDRIRALTVYNERQKIVASKEVDRDIWSVVIRHNDASGVMFKVRDGKVVGNQHFYLTNVEGKEEGEVLEHLIQPKEALQEIRRCIKDEGYCILLVPIETPLFRLIWFFWARLKGKVWEGAHVNHLDVSSFKNLVKEGGFKIVKDRVFLLGMLESIKVVKAI